MNLPHIYPAIVREYDRPARLYRIEIPGITDGAESLPWAELLYAAGDPSEDTEIRVKVGARCFVQFINGDSNYPLIIGFRQKHAGNMVGTRHWEHDNIHSEADTNQLHEAGQDYTVEAVRHIVIQAGTNVTIEAGANINVQSGADTNITVVGNMTTVVEGNMVATVVGNAALTAAATEINSPTVINGTLLVNGLITGTAGMAVSGGAGAAVTGNMAITGGDVTADGISLKGHVHGENGDGGGTTDPPS